MRIWCERIAWPLIAVGTLGILIVLTVGPVVTPSEDKYEEAANLILHGNILGLSWGKQTTPEREAIARNQAMQEVNRRQRAIEASLCAVVIIAGVLMLVFYPSARRFFWQSGSLVNR